MRIVLIDDDPLSCEYIKAVLNALRVELHIFNDSQSAFMELDTKLTPALFLLDQILIDELGTEILAKLRNDPRFDEFPIFLLTADAEKNTITEAMKNKVTGYILKPADQKTVLRLKKALMDWYDIILEDQEEVKRRLRIMTPKLNSYIDALISQTSEMIMRYKTGSDKDEDSIRKKVESCKTIAHTVGASHLYRKCIYFLNTLQNKDENFNMDDQIDVLRVSLDLLQLRWTKKIP